MAHNKETKQINNTSQPNYSSIRRVLTYLSEGNIQTDSNIPHLIKIRTRIGITYQQNKPKKIVRSMGQDTISKHLRMQLIQRSNRTDNSRRKKKWQSGFLVKIQTTFPLHWFRSLISVFFCNLCCISKIDFTWFNWIFLNLKMTTHELWSTITETWIYFSFTNNSY